MDTITLPYHTDTLYKAYTGEKKIKIFNGTHNSMRPQAFLAEVAQFVLEAIQRNIHKNANIINVE